MKYNKGFTLIELIIVMAIMSILLGMSYPKVSKYISKSKNEQLKIYKKSLEKGLRQCYAIDGKYPSDIKYLEQHNYGIIVDVENYNIDYTAENDVVHLDVSIKK